MWVGKDGYPLSWKHWVYGSGYIVRARNRRMIDDATSSRAGQAGKNDFSRWRREMLQVSR